MVDLIVILSSIASLALNCLLVIRLGRRRSLAFPFFVALLLVYSIPHFFAPFIFQYESHVYLTASLLSLLFFCFYIILNFVFLSFDSKAAPEVSSLKITPGVYYLSFLVFLCSLLMMLALYEFNIDLMLSSGWADFRNNQSVLKVLSLYLLCPASGLLIASIVLKKRLGIYLVVVFLLFSVFVLKTRGYVVIILLPIIFYFLLFKSWTLKKAVVLSVVFCLFFLIYSVSRELRHLGSALDVSQVRFKIDTQEFELVDNLYYLISKEDNMLAVKFKDLSRVALLLIPSDILPFTKPRENAKELWDERTGVLGVEGSLHPNFFGNLIAESPAFGWFVYAFLSVISFYLLDKLLGRLKYSGLILFSAVVSTSFYIARGAFYNGVLLLLFSICFVLLSELFLQLYARRLALRVL